MTERQKVLLEVHRLLVEQIESLDQEPTPARITEWREHIRHIRQLIDAMDQSKPPGG